MTPPPPPNAVIYVRTLTDKIHEEVLAARDLAVSRGWSVAKVFEDATTSRSRRCRKGFVAVLQMVSRGAVQVMIISRLSDIFFGAAEGLEILAGFAKAGVRIVCTHTAFDSSRVYAPADLAAFVLDAVTETSVERRVMAVGAALQRDRRIGRPRVRIDAEAVRGLLAKGIPLRQLAREVRVGYGTLQRHWASSKTTP